MDQEEKIAIELSAIMCSRVCHDVISPVGAITNGLEVLDDEDDEEMRTIAFDLIKNSARQASAKLQFARLAFGAAGSEGAVIDLGDAEEVVAGLLGDSKVAPSWKLPRETWPKNEVKLLLNLILIGLSTVPRGGTMTVSRENDEISVVCEGQAAMLPEQTDDILSGTLELDKIDPRTVQTYLADRLARSIGFELALSLDGEIASIRARSTADADA